MPTAFDTAIFSRDWDTDWHMQGGERTALIHLLTTATPSVSLEIGTFRGGSLRPIAHFSKRTYTFDIDPNHRQLQPLFPTVEFVTGDTSRTLPPVIDAITKSGEELGFILVDGSHETAGVLADIDACLRYRPRTKPCFIAMHDSANPAVRKGIRAAGWQRCMHAAGLDLDFVPGALYARADIRNQIWGGLAVAVLLPETRVGSLPIRDNFEYTLQTLQASLPT